MSNAILTTVTDIKNPVPPPMRGIKQAITELKTVDPDTALTERALRRLVMNGTIPSVKIGRKYLINMNVLNSYLSGEYNPIKPVQTTPPHFGEIRAVHV